MSTHQGILFAAALCSLFFADCGENTTNTPGGGTPTQQGLKALSVNASTVRFQWSAVQGVPDSAVLGYLVSWSGRSDNLPKTVLSYAADSLSSGETTFNIHALLTGGGTGPTATIRWAPAARFDSSLILTEYYAQEPQRVAGLDLGGTTSDPAALAVDANNPSVGQTLDLYLFGGEGEIAQPLALRSASLLVGSWNTTVFSTVSHASASLDYPLERFPDVQTFTLNSIPVTDNTIYYARVTGNQGGTHYVRIQVGVTTGAGRNRSVILRLSVQRVPGLPYA